MISLINIKLYRDRTMNQDKALRQTIDHIDLVMRLLASAQIELMRRQFTHDRSKLDSPEWEMFEQITSKLEGLTYGSEEYEKQRQEMLGQALQHHYDHNRHHPEFFESRQPDKIIESHLTMAKWALQHGQVMPDDVFGYDALIRYIEQKQQEHQSSVNNMNLFDLIEMFIDWNAAVKRHADGDINRSIEINTKRFALSPQIVEIFKNTIPWVKDEFADLKYQDSLSTFS
jgi:hypothetical protein